jgi:hypothetical protein
MQTYKTQRVHLFIGIIMLIIALGSFGIASAQTEGSPVILDDTAKIRITNLIANMTNKSDALTRRYESIASRVESRARIMEARGQDMTDSFFYVSEARGSIAQVATAMENIDTEVARMLVSQDPVSVWTDIRLTLTQVRAMHERTHAILGEAYLDLVDEQLAWDNGEYTDEATTTSESDVEITSEAEVTVQ